MNKKKTIFHFITLKLCTIMCYQYIEQLFKSGTFLISDIASCPSILSTTCEHYYALSKCDFLFCAIITASKKLASLTFSMTLTWFTKVLLYFKIPIII